MHAQTPFSRVFNRIVILENKVDGAHCFIPNTIIVKGVWRRKLRRTKRQDRIDMNHHHFPKWQHRCKSRTQETKNLPASMAPLPKRDEHFIFASPIHSSLSESVSSLNRNAWRLSHGYSESLIDGFAYL
jgi:hypothetical protein